jgi:SNF2 family DNA or RNA helicase
MTKRKPAPLPHQETGTRFLRDRRAAGLFDEQGLGKTRQVIDAIAADIEAAALDGALVICPNTLKTTWADEVKRFSTLRCAVFGSGRAARRSAFRHLRAQIYVINYESVAAELPALQALLRFKRIAVVLDESHRIKSVDAKVTKAVHALRRDAARRYILTGTPVANRPEDVWSQIFFLDDGASLGDFAQFRERYCAGDAGYIRLEELRERIGAISLRREKLGTVPLPLKTITRLPVPLAGAQAVMYETMRDELELLVRGMNDEEFLAHAENLLARLVRLTQLASNPRLLDRSYRETPSKFAALDTLVEDALRDPVRKVLVWSSFVDNVRELARRYPAACPVQLHGEMDGAARDRAIRSFRTDPAVRMLVANPAAAREGLTLTEANVAIYVDRTFNLVDYLQSQDRIHRLSQTRDCEIVLLVAANTIDEFVDFSLAQKHRLARYTQGDCEHIDPEDAALQKPDVLRALIRAPR